MLHRLCQVCGDSAVDRATGRIWWLLADGPNGAPGTAGYTNAPPTCLTCIPDALVSCPRLRRGAVVYSVGGSEPYGVVADLFEPSTGGRAIQVQRNVSIQLDEFRRLEHALAKQLLVLLSDLEREPAGAVR
ncbi:hypothetical protein GCM10010404_32200 [Nonomuraea africana]